MNFIEAMVVDMLKKLMTDPHSGDFQAQLAYVCLKLLERGNADSRLKALLNELLYLKGLRHFAVWQQLEVFMTDQLTITDE